MTNPQHAIEENMRAVRNAFLFKRFFLDLERRFGIPVSKGMDSKAAMICNYFGIEWSTECDSSESPSGGGGTVTKQGLLHLLAATKRGLAEEIKN